MKAKPLSVQLYSLREYCESGMADVLKKVSDFGYVGVEPAGLYDLTPKEFRTIVEDLDMVVSSSHGPWVTPDNIPEVIDTAGILGVNLVIGGFGTNEFKDLEAIKATAEKINRSIETLKEAGLTMVLHNHYWEFDTVDGRLAYDHLAGLCPELQFEIDVYWAANFGTVDPVEQVRKFSSRMPLMHVKDGPLVREQAQVAVGAGKMDIPEVIKAADNNVLQWLVVELDDCDGDMYDAVENSVNYLADKGLGRRN